MTSVLTPQFTHDCEDCKFLGRDHLDNDPVDVYVCPQDTFPTIVIRFSSKPGEYTSWNFIFLDGSTGVHGRSKSYALAAKYHPAAKEALNK